jgi:hypothetical protein
MPQVTQLAANPATTIATPSRCGKSLRAKSSVLGQTRHRLSFGGVPAAIGAARPEVRVWALGQFEAEPEADAPFDAVAVADAPPRADPCAVFD